MIPYELLFGFAFLYSCAKLMEWKLPFYAAAALFAVALPVTELLVTTLQVPAFGQLFPSVIILFIAALPVFYLLEKYQDTIAAWLVTFAIGFIVLVMYL